MDWMQVVAIIGSLLGGIAYIHSDIKEIKKGLDKQTDRTDKLYEMFIDLLKEMK